VGQPALQYPREVFTVIAGGALRGIELNSPDAALAITR
jgi:hypothetical protein